MIAALGFGTLVTFMVTVMRKWATAFVAIIAAPVLFAIIAGFGPQLGDFALSGIETVAETAVLLLFAVLYFGLMMDQKLFDPISRGILRLSKGDPLWIIVGTAVFAILIALDGDGTTSYMLICAAFLPVYRRLGINPLVIATLAVMALGLISGSTPWGGAATRAISVLHLDATEYFVHMIPALALTSAFIIVVAVFFGLRARRTVDAEAIASLRAEVAEHKGEKVGWKTWFNAALTVLLLVLLIMGVAPLVILFIGGFVIALVVNHPNLVEQGDVVKKHASSAVPVVMLVLAAGVFTGILTESGMIEAMAQVVLSAVPQSLGEYIPLITALFGIPLSFFMANDAYFFGVLPVLASSAAAYGIDPMEIARAGVIGQMAHMIGPASAPLWVLLGLLKAELGDLHRFSMLWIVAGSLVFTLFAVLTGAVSTPLF
jgi:CitMHS family citrate-Mg2+:H+ or citrate-Ca2+:H+ symporter